MRKKFRPEDSLCKVMRTMLVKSGTLNMATGASSITKEEWVTKPCGTPHFREPGSKCRACESGWTHPQNYPADSPPATAAVPSQYQAERQRRRTRAGKYEKMNRCDRCKKPWKRDLYQQISDDPALKAACVADFGVAVGCICHDCIRILLPE